MNVIKPWPVWQEIVDFSHRGSGPQLGAFAAPRKRRAISSTKSRISRSAKRAKPSGRRIELNRIRARISHGRRGLRGQPLAKLDAPLVERVDVLNRDAQASWLWVCKAGG